MVKTASVMLPLGTVAPNFSLPDPSGKMVSLSDFKKAPALLVMFICNHCPFVVHVRDELARLGKDYQNQGVAIIAINANNIETHPDDSPAKMAVEHDKAGYTFPYLFDETQEIAQAYKAACTPDFYLFDSKQELVYRGQLDTSRPGSDNPVTGEDLRAALDSVLKNQPVAQDQKPSLGCNIKWKPGNEPDYFNV